MFIIHLDEAQHSMRDKSPKEIKTILNALQVVMQRVSRMFPVSATQSRVRLTNLKPFSYRGLFILRILSLESQTRSQPRYVRCGNPACVCDCLKLVIGSWHPDAQS